MNSIINKIKTTCNPIDNLLNGGIEIGTITQIYGESGSGKTNLCLQISIEFIKSSYNKANNIFIEFINNVKNDYDIDYYKKVLKYTKNINIILKNINKESFIKYKKKYQYFA